MPAAGPGGRAASEASESRLPTESSGDGRWSSSESKRVIRRDHRPRQRQPPRVGVRNGSATRKSALPSHSTAVAHGVRRTGARKSLGSRRSVHLPLWSGLRSEPDRAADKTGQGQCGPTTASKRSAGWRIVRCALPSRDTPFRSPSATGRTASRSRCRRPHWSISWTRCISTRQTGSLQPRQKPRRSGLFVCPGDRTADPTNEHRGRTLRAPDPRPVRETRSQAAPG